MGVPTQTYSLAIPEFYERLMNATHPTIEGELSLKEALEVEANREKPSFFEESDTVSNVKIRRSISAEIFAREMEAWLLDGRLYFENPTTKGRLLLTDARKEMYEHFFDLHIPLSLLQSFAAEIFSVDIVWQATLPLLKAQEFMPALRQAKKEETQARYQRWIDKAEELLMRNSTWVVSHLARLVKNELKETAGVKTIQNTLYASGKFPKKN